MNCEFSPTHFERACVVIVVLPPPRLSLRRRRLQLAILGIALGVLLGVLWARFQRQSAEGLLAQHDLWLTYALAIIAGAVAGYLAIAVPRAVVQIFRKFWWQVVQTQSADKAQILANKAQARLADPDDPPANPAHTANDLAVIACLRRQYQAAMQRLTSLPRTDRGPEVCNLFVTLVELQKWTEAAALLSQATTEAFPESNLARAAYLAPGGEMHDRLRQAVEKRRLPRALNNMAVRLIQEDRLPEARGLLRRCLEIRSSYVNALSNLATVAYREGDLIEGLLTISRASEEAPGEPIVCSNLGAILCENSDPPTAEQWLVRAADRAPHSSEVQINLGNCCALQLKYAEALDSYRTAARREEFTAIAEYDAALVQIEVGEYDSAAERLQIAHLRAPGDADILNNLGYIFWRQKAYEQSQEAFNRAAELNPTGTAVGNLVCAELAAGRAGEALELLAEAKYEAVDMAFDKGLAHMLAALGTDREAGMTQRRLYDHHLQNAQAGFGAVINLREGPVGEAYINLALVEYLAEQFDSSAKSFAEAAKRFPEIPELGYYAGVSFLLGGMQKQSQHAEPGADLSPATLDYFRQARPFLERAMEARGVGEEAAYNLGILYYLTGDYSKAIAVLKKAAVQDAPPETFNALAIAQARAAQELYQSLVFTALRSPQRQRQIEQEIGKLLSGAIHYFRLVLKLQPHSPVVHANVGLAHLLRNRGDDVETALHHWQLMRQIGGAWGQRAFELFSRAAAGEEAKRLKFQDVEMTFRPVPARSWVHYVPPRLAGRRYIMQEFPDLPLWTLQAYDPQVKRAVRYRELSERARAELHLLGA